MINATKSPRTTRKGGSMVNQAEVRESHEQFSAAWSLYARCSGAGEVAVDAGRRRVAQPGPVIEAPLPEPVPAALD